ncbi:hypothetical protein RVR_8358 [Actinacidiphila reveromycinica]|uniref:Uncharacterized protein n=1 Tax=Actinacidiphila reveromycinica TaxID=659352 RepID=A0A7U3UYB4_9ACTN|nr:hypothetical protein [Streptomyces sp. SN-593]BBB01103.1 hypothetical protein RVR_8358 [Streptomyces sp. SN-593]
MSISLDRMGDLFGNAEVRQQFIDAVTISGLSQPNLVRVLTDWPFSEAARSTYFTLRGGNTATTDADRNQVDHAVVLAKYLVLCGYAMHRARSNSEAAGDDWSELLVFVKDARARMMEVSVGDAWSAAFAYIIERCEWRLRPGGPAEDRADAYAALRYLATTLAACSGFRPEWTLEVGDVEQ